jgi:DNA invertase Pin-like site-specific DNA recombinase
VKRIEAKGAALRILAIGVDTSASTGKLMLNVLASVAQFEREVMLERQREGIAKAKGEGRCKGRVPTARAKAGDIYRLAAEGLTRAAIAAHLKIGAASVYRALRAAQGSQPDCMPLGRTN